MWFFFSSSVFCYRWTHTFTCYCRLPCIVSVEFNIKWLSEKSLHHCFVAAPFPRNCFKPINFILPLYYRLNSSHWYDINWYSYYVQHCVLYIIFGKKTFYTLVFMWMPCLWVWFIELSYYYVATSFFKKQKKNRKSTFHIHNITFSHFHSRHSLKVLSFVRFRRF